MIIRRFLSGMLVGAFLFSCGDGGGAGTSSDFISSYCAVFQPCCAMAKLPSDGRQCRTLLTAFAPQGSYNAAAGEACLTSVRAAASRPDFCAGASGDDPACDAVFGNQAKGTGKPGEACTDDDDCAPSTEGTVECQRQSTGGAEIRKCQVQVIGKDGDQPCVGTVEGNVTSFGPGFGTDVPPKAFLCRVADGLHCDWDTHACSKFKAVGEMCTSGDDCGPNGYCDGTRKCAARKAVGEACTGSFISRTECAPGGYCSEGTMACAAQQGDGAACTDDEQCKSSECVNGKCKGDVPVNLGLAFVCGGT